MDTDEEAADTQLAIDLLGRERNQERFLDTLSLAVDAPLETLSLCARPMIVAAPGRKLVDADFSNIEGRLNAWFAGERWKLKAFEDYDRGEGPDLYKVTASRVLNKAVDDVTKAERQNQGKVPELACGYQGGVRAFQKMGAKYGVSIPDAHVRRIVADWRAANPNIEASWHELQDAAIKAVRAPGCIVPVLGDKVRYLKPPNQDFLFCRLPSGRVISYAKPAVGWKTKVVDMDGEKVEFDSFGLTYWGAKNGKFIPLDLYGGAQCAHIVSGTARDLLVEAMFAVERAGYPIILTVHDELLAEVPRDFGSAEHFEQVIRDSRPGWAEGLPLVGKAWEGDRYAK